MLIMKTVDDAFILGMRCQAKKITLKIFKSHRFLWITKWSMLLYSHTYRQVSQILSTVDEEFHN